MKTRPADEYLKTLKKRYAEAGKVERGKILDEFVATSGYHRKHAIGMLNGKRVRIGYRAKRPRALIYGKEELRAVLQLVIWFDGISSRRLRAAMDVELKRLRAAGHLRVSAACFKKLERISAATMDRLRRMHNQHLRKIRGGTKPGSLLKHHIPIRTFADWDDKKIGFLEMDLVQHDGGNPSGMFACTLNMTDVSTGWTEMMAVQNKAQVRVFAALEAIRARMPLDWLGIDSDNGVEFINNELIRYSEREQLTFTRGRVARKNDNAFVEQKNWSVVRKLVGYGRFDTAGQVKQLNALYDRYRLYINYFLPVSKLLSKERHGSKVKRKFDVPKTAYQRLLDSADVSHSRKIELCSMYRALDIVVLQRDIDRLSRRLMESRQS